MIFNLISKSFSWEKNKQTHTHFSSLDELRMLSLYYLNDKRVTLSISKEIYNGFHLLDSDSICQKRASQSPPPLLGRQSDLLDERGHGTLRPIFHTYLYTSFPSPSCTSLRFRDSRHYSLNTQKKPLRETCLLSSVKIHL